MEIRDETFERSKVRIVEESSAETEKDDLLSKSTPYTHIILQFTEEALYRLYDDFDDKWIVNNGDGTYTLEINLPEDEWVYGYILSFGCFVKVIEPEHIREIIKDRSMKISEFYN